MIPLNPLSILDLILTTVLVKLTKFVKPKQALLFQQHNYTNRYKLGNSLKAKFVINSRIYFILEDDLGCIYTKLRR